MLGEHPDAELAPRDVVTRRRSRLGSRPAGPATCRCATSIRERVRRRFPNLVEGCARLGTRPVRAIRCPVAPAAHYLMGGDRHGPRRRDHDRRPVRRRRVRLHRSARRQPAGVELAARVLRLRPPRRRRWPGRRRRAVVADGRTARPAARSGRRSPSCGGGCGTAPAPYATGRASSGSPRGSTTSPSSNPVPRRNA